MTMEYDVVVVGAGVAGLYSGWQLSDAGLNILVLEGRDHVGGRQWTYRDPDIGYADMGAAFVGTAQTRIMKVLKSLDIDTYKVSDGNRQTSVMRLKSSGRLTYSSGIPSFKNPLCLLDLNNLMRKVENMSKQVTIDCPWEATSAQQWDSISLQQFFDDNIWTKEGMALARMAILIPSAVDPKDMSLLSLLHAAKCCGGLEDAASSNEGLQEFKISGGSCTISEKMAYMLQGSLKLNKYVNKISEIEGGVKVCSSDGSEYTARKVIVTVPIPAITNIQFTPELPQYLQKLSSIKPACRTTKTYMYYETAFWKQHGINGDLASEDGVIMFAMDDTKPGGLHPCIMGFINAAHATKYSSLSQEERKKLIAEQYAADFGLDQFLSPINYVEKNWQDEDSQVHGKGCCIWSLPPGALTDARKLPSPQYPAGNVYFAGTEAALTYAGYMEGALRSGHYAAAQICESLGAKFSYTDGEFNEEIPYKEMDIARKYLPSVPVCIALLVIIVLVVLILIIGLIMYFTV